MSIFSFPHYKQHSNNDCGPTCLKIIAKHFGKTIAIEQIKSLFNIERNGVSIHSLTMAAEQIGFKAIVFEVTMAQLRTKAILPCVAFIDNRHFVVIYKVSNKKVFVSDPALGKCVYTDKQFQSIFIPSGYNFGIIVCLEPETKFHKTDWAGKDKGIMSYAKITLLHLSRYKQQLVQLAIVMLIITMLQAVAPFIFRSVMDIGINKKNMSFIQIMMIANIVILLCTSFSNVIKDFIVRHVGIRFSASIISSYLMSILSMPLGFFESISSGEILNKIKDHEIIKNFALFHFVNFSYAIMCFLIYGTILCFFNRATFFIFLSCTILYVVWVLCFKRAQEKLEWRTHNLNSQNNNFWVETIHNISEIKSNNYEYWHREKWERIQVSLYHQDINTLRIRNMQDVGSQIINGLKNILATFYCARLVVDGEMTFGGMIAIQFMLGFLNTPVNQLIGFIQAYPSAKQSLFRLNEIHNTHTTNSSSVDISDFMSTQKDIRIEKLYFRYSNTGNYSLRNITTHIEAGKTTAIVGKSGSGKSTLIKILLGLYDATSGSLLIDNVHAKNLDMVRWRERCAIVLQDGWIFNNTILNNIVLNDVEVDYARLTQIFEIVQLHSLLKELPDGHSTLLGQNGRALSQGQRQRILLARALYRNPNYLFMDEATNAIDSYTENKILTAIRNYMHGKTLVIATHRINTVSDVDRIIVMNEGMIVESGAHDVLMERKELYFLLNNIK